MKKRVAILLAVCLAAVFSLAACGRTEIPPAASIPPESPALSASAAELSTPEERAAAAQTQWERLDLMEQIQKRLSDEEFAGLYLDENGIIHVNVTCPTDSSNLLRRGEQVVYHQVNYSLAYLEGLMGRIGGCMVRYHIALLDANELTNQLDIIFEDGCNTQESQAALLDILGLPEDNDICSFSALPEGVRICFT